MSRLPLRGSLYGQRLGVDADLDTAGPVGVHGSVLVVETFQLELQVRSPHQSLVNLPGGEAVITPTLPQSLLSRSYLRFKVKDMV